MALILPRSVFYHIPKTGGQWTNKVLYTLELVQSEYRENLPRGVLNLTYEHVSPVDAREDVVGDLLSFAFIRNPIQWYQSFWRYKQGSEWDDPYGDYGDADFNVFMKKIMDITPGFLTRVYKRFDGVDFLGKQENLRNDLISILNAIGEDFDPGWIAETPRYGVTKPIALSCEYDPKVLKRMQKLEGWIFKKYYPEEL